MEDKQPLAAFLSQGDLPSINESRNVSHGQHELS